MIADEPTAPVSSKRKPGAGGKKQPPAMKEFDPFEEDMDEGAGDMTTANKRRRHGISLVASLCHISPHHNQDLHAVGADCSEKR